eukprot:1187941-Prorocentrum_minimum.AAC.3
MPTRLTHALRGPAGAASAISLLPATCLRTALVTNCKYDWKSGHPAGSRHSGNSSSVPPLRAPCRMVWRHCFCASSLDVLLAHAAGYSSVASSLATSRMWQRAQ